jgi:hypothetical protein
MTSRSVGVGPASIRGVDGFARQRARLVRRTRFCAALAPRARLVSSRLASTALDPVADRLRAASSVHVDDQTDRVGASLGVRHRLIQPGDQVVGGDGAPPDHLGLDASDEVGHPHQAAAFRLPARCEQWICSGPEGGAIRISAAIRMVISIRRLGTRCRSPSARRSRPRISGA